MARNLLTWYYGYVESGFSNSNKSAQGCTSFTRFFSFCACSLSRGLSRLTATNKITAWTSNIFTRCNRDANNSSCKWVVKGSSLSLLYSCFLPFTESLKIENQMDRLGWPLSASFWSWLGKTAADGMMREKEDKWTGAFAMTNFRISWALQAHKWGLICSGTLITETCS